MDIWQEKLLKSFKHFFVNIKSKMNNQIVKKALKKENSSA